MAITAAHGWVYDERKGQPIIAATVELLTTGTETVVSSTTTNSVGYWAFAAQPSAVYDIRIRWGRNVLRTREYGEAVVS